MLLALIQSLVQDPENERLVRKMSHKPAISRSQQVRGTPWATQEIPLGLLLVLTRLFPLPKVHLAGCSAQVVPL